MDETLHCYFIVSPDPSKFSRLYIEGEAFSQTDDQYEEPQHHVKIQPDHVIHFVKFGDEKKITERVGKYRTHNPSFWWRTIKLKDTTDVDTSVGLGTFLKERYFKNLQKPYTSNEWYALQSKRSFENLIALCNRLDAKKKTVDLEEKTEQGEIVKRKWWVSEFEDLGDLDGIFRKVFE